MSVLTKKNVTFRIFIAVSVLFAGFFCVNIKTTNTSQKGVTPEVFEKHKASFTSDVFHKHGQLNYWKPWKSWLGEQAVLKGARALQCGSFETKCIPLSYDLFQEPKEYVESLIAQIKTDSEMLEDANLLYLECSKKPGDMEWFAQSSHAAHIRKRLPDNESKEAFIKDPDKYKQFLDQQMNDAVSKEARHKDQIVAMFVRYCQANKIQL